MPGVLDDNDYRVVIAEESFDWRSVTSAELPQVLDALADLLEPLADGRKAAFVDVAYDAPCLTSVKLVEALYSPNGGLPPDERRRLQVLLDKCVIVEAAEDDIPQPVRIRSALWREPSWGVAHAVARAASGKLMSCLMCLPITGLKHADEPTWPSGWIDVERQRETGVEQVPLHILRVPRDEAGFWRGVITREKVPEDQFFALSDLAFPRLIFAESLSFHRFKGTYADVVPWLVNLLGLLNDQFAATLAACGDQKEVQDRFKAQGVDISPESPNTKKNSAAWAQRLVSYSDEYHRCEWHGKRLWDCDRVHFSLPISAYDGRILIGIFTDHLDT